MQTATQKALTERWRFVWERFFSPVRFVALSQEDIRKDGMMVTRRAWQRHEYMAWAQRFPLAIVLFGLFLWEETSPIAMVQLHGPSMLPTIAPDESDIWIIAPMQSIWRRWFFTPQYKRNDLVGFTRHNDTAINNTNASQSYISCKRIIGLPGDTVQRYGQFVHLYVPQDPEDWGILWPPSIQSTDWAQSSRRRTDRRPDDTIVVPPDHVWVEGDCPGLALDSRQLGPIPMSSIRGRVVGRLWPLWRSKLDDPLYSKNFGQRPQPIPLDDNTLRLYNVHRVPKPTSDSSI